MVYREENVTRWHDIDARRHVRPSYLLTYMQELACHQMESLGQGLDGLRDEEGLAFILTRIVIHYHAKLGPMEPYVGQTWVSPAKGMFHPERGTGCTGLQPLGADAAGDGTAGSACGLLLPGGTGGTIAYGLPAPSLRAGGTGKGGRTSDCVFRH